MLYAQHTHTLSLSQKKKKKDLSFGSSDLRSNHVACNFQRQNVFLTALLARLDKEDADQVADGAEGSVQHELNMLRRQVIHR